MSQLNFDSINILPSPLEDNGDTGESDKENDKVYLLIPCNFTNFTIATAEFGQETKDRYCEKSGGNYKAIFENI